jgi:mono/diheme cytochrome c family protein
MNNVFKFMSKKYLVYFLVMFCFLVFSPLKNSTAEILVSSEIQETSDGQLLMAFKRDRSQRLLHGKGRRGAGICPQARSTPPAPDKYLKMKNPLEPNRDIVEKGKALFQYEAQPTACKVCHGSLGNGLGIMLGLNPMPRNFTCKKTMAEISDGQMFYIITHGSQGTAMPAFLSLSDNQVWQLITYIRSLSKDKSRLRRRR